MIHGGVIRKSHLHIADEHSSAYKFLCYTFISLLSSYPYSSCCLVFIAISFYGFIDDKLVKYPFLGLISEWLDSI